MINYQTTGKWLFGLFAASLIAAVVIIVFQSKGTLTSQQSGGESSIGSGPIMKADTIAVLNIMSEISYADQRSSFINREGALYWIEMLKAAENNPNIKAVILRINSPGGSVAATQEVYEAVKRLRAAGKIVVASFGDVAASGAYYIACAADKIVANPGTLTGSIGVVISGFQFSGIMDEYGISVNVIKSGDYKDIMSPYRPMTDNEKRIMQSIIMDTWRQFVDSVAEGRQMDVGKVEKLADGRIYGAIQALDAGLIDELGDFHKAVEVTAELAGINGEPNVVELKPDMRDMFRYFSYAIGDYLRPRAEINLLGSQTSMSYQSPILYLFSY